MKVLYIPAAVPHNGLSAHTEGVIPCITCKAHAFEALEVHVCKLPLTTCCATDGILLIANHGHHVAVTTSHP